MLLVIDDEGLHARRDGMAVGGGMDLEGAQRRMAEIGAAHHVAIILAASEIWLELCSG